MRPSAAAAFLAATLLSGCVSEGGYFAERGYFPQRHAGWQPAVAPLPLSPAAPVQAVGVELPFSLPHVDNRTAQPASVEPATPAVIAPSPPAARLGPPGEAVRPVPAEYRRSRAPQGAPVAAEPRIQGGALWRPPALQPRTPDVGSPEWQREQLQTDRRERDLNRTLKSICSGC